MKRPAGLVLFAALFFMLGTRLLLGRAPANHQLGASALQTVLGVVSVGVAYGLWTRRAEAMKAYWTWVVAWLIGGGIAQFVYQDVPLLLVAIWWVFVATVLGAVGLYLRGVVRSSG